MNNDINNCCGDNTIDNTSTNCGCLGDGFVIQQQPQVYQPSSNGYGSNYVITVNNIPGPYVSLTTTNIPEGTNLYFTNSRVLNLLSAISPISYNNTTGQISLINSGVSAGTYGNANNYSSFTVDVFGRITSASQIPLPTPVNLGILLTSIQNINLQSSGFLFDLGNGTTSTMVTRNILPSSDNSVLVTSALQGDVTIGLPNISTTTAGNYGSNSQTLVLGVNNKGIITGISAVAINFPSAPTIVSNNNTISITTNINNISVDIAQQGATNGQVLSWNGSKFAPANSGAFNGISINSNIFNGNGLNNMPLDLDVSTNIQLNGAGRNNTHYSPNGYIYILNTIDNKNSILISSDNGISFVPIDLYYLNTNGTVFSHLVVDDGNNVIYITNGDNPLTTISPIIYKATITIGTANGFVLGQFVQISTTGFFLSNETIVYLKVIYNENLTTGIRSYPNKIYITTIYLNADNVTHNIKFYTYDISTGIFSSGVVVYTNIGGNNATYIFDFDKVNAGLTNNFICISGFVNNNGSVSYNNIQPFYYSINGGSSFSIAYTPSNSGSGLRYAIGGCVVVNGNVYIDSSAGTTTLGANATGLLFQFSIPTTSTAPTVNDISSSIPTNSFVSGITTTKLNYISMGRILIAIAATPVGGQYNNYILYNLLDSTISTTSIIKLNNGAFDFNYNSLGVGFDEGSFAIPSVLNGTPTSNNYDFNFFEIARFLLNGGYTSYYFFNKTLPFNKRTLNVATGINSSNIVGLDYNKLIYAPIKTIDTTDAGSVTIPTTIPANFKIYLNVDVNGRLFLSTTSQTIIERNDAPILIN